MKLCRAKEVALTYNLSGPVGYSYGGSVGQAKEVMDGNWCQNMQLDLADRSISPQPFIPQTRFLSLL